MDDTIEIHVDAKIFNRDKKDNHRTLVGYCYADGSTGERKRILEADSNQSDAAELYAIHFALERLEPQHRKFTIFCDNKSVVEQLDKDLSKSNRVMRPILKETWALLQKNREFFEVKPFQINRAHAFLNEKSNETEDASETGED